MFSIMDRRKSDDGKTNIMCVRHRKEDSRELHITVQCGKRVYKYYEMKADPEQNCRYKRVVFFIEVLKNMIL